MITFKAQYIKPVSIERKGLDSKFHPYQVALIEFNPKSEQDFLSLNVTNCNWGNCKTLLHDIMKKFNFLHRGLRMPQEERFFGITKQKEHFDKLEPDKILGVLQTRRNRQGKFEIENFQVSPNTNYDAIVRDYKGVGKALLEHIKEHFVKEKEILLDAKKSAIPFYEKFGFIKTGYKNQMIFRR